MIEVGVVIDDREQPLFWHCPPDRSQIEIPDSHELWAVLWENRERVAGFAHSHPGSGAPTPSLTDLSTFLAIESGLGRRLRWWIITRDRVSEFAFDGEHYRERAVTVEPAWVSELRRRSEENLNA